VSDKSFTYYCKSKIYPNYLYFEESLFGQAILGFGLTFTSEFGVNEVSYGTTAQSLHESVYSSYNETTALHHLLWSTTAIAFNDVAWQSTDKITTQSIHESSWESIDSSSAIAIHESAWSSSLRSTTQAAQEAFYGTISTSTLIGLHEAGWASVGGLASVMGLHEIGWSFTPSAMSLQSASFKSVIETRSLHEVYYETYQTSVIMTLHECRYRSNQVTPIINTGLIYARI